MQYRRFHARSFKMATYPSIVISWLIVMIIFEYFTFLEGVLPTYHSGKYLMAGLLIFNQIFVALFFYFGISNLVIPIRYQVVKKRAREYEMHLLAQSTPTDWQPRVQLLYTTYNDFIPYAFHQCLQQTYSNCIGVILDNSTDEECIEQIRQFVKTHPGVKWIRDVPNHHAKAGNLDNYLLHEGKGTYDYFVVLDSDEMLEPEFVEKALKFFYFEDNLGLLQANHISGRNINKFMTMFANSGNVFWPVQNTVRSIESAIMQPYDTTTNQTPHMVNAGDMVAIGLGHGMMVSKECFADIGKFPWMVAEDLCTSFETLMCGWNIRFALTIYGNEEFPVNMEAVIIRSSKFCSANFEFMKYYGKRLFKTDKLSNRQKLDLLSFTMSVPIFAFEYVSILLGSVILPLNDVPMGYQTFFVIPTLVCYFSQGISDSFFQIQNGMKIWTVINYELQAMLMYGSMYYIVLKCTILALFGKPAKFNVTPKLNNRITFTQAFHENVGGIVFSLITIIMAMSCSGSSWILLSFLPGCVGFVMSLKANQQTDAEKAKEKRFDQLNEYALYQPTKCDIEWDE